MGYNKFETDTTTKKSGGTGGTGTVGVGKSGVQSNNQTNTEMAQRGSEHASEVVVVVD